MRIYKVTFSDPSKILENITVIMQMRVVGRVAITKTDSVSISSLWLNL